jgi:DNA-binding NtrC family response regulator
MKESETKKLLAMLRAQYQHRFVIDDVTQMVWHGLLNEPPELPTQAVYNAAMTWMRDNEWPPQVRDLRDIIASQVVGIPDADAAWRHLQDWLKAGYPNRTVDNRPPLPDLIGATVKEMGGTSTIREMGEKARTKFDHVYNRRRRDEVQAANVTESWDRLTAVDSGTRKAIA